MSPRLCQRFPVQKEVVCILQEEEEAMSTK